MRIGAEATAIDVSVCVPVFNERLGLRQSILTSGKRWTSCRIPARSS